MNKKKLKKLLRDPKLFFRDMYAKRAIQVKKHLPMRYKGNNYYTIVSAVYNVEKYLDDYFNSIVKQSLSFKKHIQIILVDDGSTDNSAQIIKKWQARFPKNIHYFYKENGGQASARNLGLEYVQTEWVVFTDPDDYLHPDYFKSVDYHLTKNVSATMLVTNLKLFIENQGIIKDSHPLKFRFDKTHTIKVSNLDRFINLSAASTFFKVSYINRNRLHFNHQIKPNFEDGKFIADYLLQQQNADVIFNKDAIYFYRKRNNSSSTLDTSWLKPEKFSDIFEFGFIPMLESYKHKIGNIPSFIQKTVLYDMSWYIQYLLNRPERLDFLTIEQKQKFYNLIDIVFSYIDEKNIMEFNLIGTWLFHKVGMLGLFKKIEPPFQIAYIENIDREQKQFLVSYYTYFDLPYSIKIGNQEIIPTYEKTVVNILNDKLFVYEKRLWISYSSLKNSARIDLLLNNKSMRISIKGKIFSKGIELKELINLFMPSQKYISDGSWLLMDRETKADDNAEHFYRYMMKNHPEKSCYFVLNKTAQDWDRLEKEGFNLVEFGSKDYEEHLRKADKIISSHLEKHINNYFGDLYEYSKKFVFLQHGVTQNNLSIWVNTKINLHCFITTALPEYKEIAANFNRYKLTEKEVVLAGFPRYDSLLSKSILRGKRILIMPTWRNYIVGKNIGNGSNRRIINNSFMETSYAQHWFSFLHSKELKLLAEKYEHKVTFAPHPNIEPYLPLFKVPSYIEIWKGEEATESIQNLFGDSSILITDYSSVAFDMAYLNKAVIYYQFDRDEFFSGAHTVQKGWFDYESSGFGPVTLTEQNTFDALKNILQSGLDNKYLTRIKETFPYQDDQNCERVYQTIVALDNPEERNNLPILKNMIVHAEQNQAWELAASRIQILFDENRLEQKELDDYWNRYLNALFNSKQFNKLQNLLLENPKYSQYWQAKIDLQIGNAIKGARFFAKENTIGSQEDFLIALLISAFYKDKENTKNLLKRLNKNLEKKYRSLLEIAKKILEQDYFVALALLKTYIDTIDMANRNSLKLELLASYIYMKLGNLQGAHQCLVTYEKHTKNDPSCRIAIARLAKLRGDFDKMFIQLNRAFEENLLLIPEDLAVDYLKKMLDSGNSEGEEYLLKQFRQKYSENLEIALYEAEKLYQAQNWKGLIKVIDEFVPTSREAAYFYIIALCRLKNDKTAQYYFNDLTAQDTLAYWKLAAEVAEVKGDKVLQAKCIRKQLEYLQ